MPQQCEECREEKPYDEIVVLKCNLGFEHCICKECIAKIKAKAKEAEKFDILNG